MKTPHLKTKPKPMTRAELDRGRCLAPGCKNADHAHEELYMGGRCHPNGGTAAFYRFQSGTVLLVCAVCGMRVVELLIAKEQELVLVTPEMSVTAPPGGPTHG
jgi:hypothetical protein